MFEEENYALGSPVEVEFAPGVWTRAIFVSRGYGITIVKSVNGSCWSYINGEVRPISPLKLLAEQAD